MARKKKREAQAPGQVLREMLLLDCDEKEELSRLEALGVEPSFQNAVNLAVLRRAVKGDVAAIRYLQEAVAQEETEASPAAMDLASLTDGELLELLGRCRDG